MKFRYSVDEVWMSLSEVWVEYGWNVDEFKWSMGRECGVKSGWVWVKCRWSVFKEWMMSISEVWRRYDQLFITFLLKSYCKESQGNFVWRGWVKCRWRVLTLCPPGCRWARGRGQRSASRASPPPTGWSRAAPCPVTGMDITLK